MFPDVILTTLKSGFGSIVSHSKISQRETDVTDVLKTTSLILDDKEIIV